MFNSKITVSIVSFTIDPYLPGYKVSHAQTLIVVFGTVEHNI